MISEATADASAATGGLLIAIPVLARVFFLLISTHLVSHLTMEGSRQLRGSSVSLGGLIHSWKISRVEFQYLYRNPAPWLLTFRLALKFTILSPIPCSCIGETSDIIYVCQALKPFVAWTRQFPKRLEQRYPTGTFLRRVDHSSVPEIYVVSGIQ